MLFSVFIIAALLVACPIDADPSLDGADAPEEPGAEDSAIDYVWDRAGQQKDPAFIHEVLTDELRATTTVEDVAESVICFPPELVTRVMAQDLEEPRDDQARIVITFHVTDPAEGGDDAEVQEVIRTWEFTRAGEDWRISALPACPFEPRTG